MSIIAHTPPAVPCPVWCNREPGHAADGRDPRDFNAQLHLHRSDPFTPFVGWHVRLRQATTVHLGGRVSHAPPVVMLDEVHALTADQARQLVAGLLLAIDHATPQETPMTDAVDVLRFAGMPTGSPFDPIRRVDEQGESWSARELMPLLGYDQWRRFMETIERAQSAAINVGAPAGQFVQVTQLADAGNLGPQTRTDYRLTRFGAYLVAMNGDPRKPEIAAAQSYFAVPLITEWIRQCTVPSSGTRARELYRAFTRWPGSVGITEARFGRTLTALGYPVSKGAHYRYRPLAVA